jgi:pimeloyl-ACP methyl ester carboxylesterase
LASVTTIAITTAATLAGLWGARALAHGALLRGLRAPRVPHAQGPDDIGLPAGTARELHVVGPRGRRLFSWLVMPDDTTRPVPAVLVMHGWGANAAMMWPVVPPLRDAGFAVLLIDARCHGRSDDETFTSMPRFAEDIAAGLAWLRTQPAIAPQRIALLGHSVGAAATLLHASRQHDVRAVASLSAFAHPREVMIRWMAEYHIPFPVIGWYVLRYVQRVIGFSFDAIAPINTITRVDCPVLLVHGRDDSTVPFSDAERLLRAAPRAQLVAVEGGHDLRETLAPHAGELVAFMAAACSNDDATKPAAQLEKRESDAVDPGSSTVKA